MKPKLTFFWWVFIVGFLGIAMAQGKLGDMISWVLTIVGLVLLLKKSNRPRPESSTGTNKSKPKMPEGLAKKLARRNAS